MQQINPTLPANQTVLQRISKLPRFDGRQDISYPTSEADYYQLGTHPDLVEHLLELDKTLPERCALVVHGRPALVHPNGVIFAFATGTLPAYRLPEAFRADALEKNTVKLQHQFGTKQVWTATDFGPDWVFALLNLKVDQTLTSEGFRYAASLG